MAGNVFDQFDGPAPAAPPPAVPPAPARRNVFDQFDAPSDVAPRSFAPASNDAKAAMRSPQEPQQGETAPSPAAGSVGSALGPVGTFIAGMMPSGEAGRSMSQGHINSEAAKAQGSSTLVRDRKGEFVRKPIGEIEHYDFGPMIRGTNGELHSFNPKTDVMLRDPVTEKLIAFERDKEIDNPNWISKLWHAVAPGLATNAPSRLASSDAVPLAIAKGANLGFPTSVKTEQAAQRMADMGAFRELGVEPFAPAFHSKGGARFARTIEEMPLIGGIVKGPKTEAENALAQTQQRIAEGLGAASTDEQAGRVLQGGLDRFKNAGVRELEPGILSSRGIEPREAVPNAPLRTRAAEQRAVQAQPIREQLQGGVAETTRGVQVQAARTRDEVIAARRGADSLSDAELNTIIRTSPQETSFAARQEALFEKAWRSIPERFRIDASRNPERLQAVNTRAALAGVDAQIGSQIAGQRTITGDLANRLRNANSHFDMNDLRAMRTEVGRALSSMDPQQTRLNSQQLKQLYAAVSRDIEVGLQDIANRAYIQTRAGGNRPDQVSVEAARRADQALRDFRVADRYTRVGMGRIGEFTRILGANSPEAAMRTLATRMKEGTIDRGTIRAVREALRPEEREQVLGYLVSRMGQGRPGAKEAEAGWNIHAFATDWNRNKQALHIMLEDTPPSVRRQLDALAQISERMKYYETTKNYSGSAYSGVPMLALATGAVTGGWGGVAALVGQIGGGAALGKFLTNPQYLNWMVRAARVSEAEMARGSQFSGVDSSKWALMAAQLERLAANDKELGPVILDALGVVNKKAVNADRDKPEGSDQRK